MAYSRRARQDFFNDLLDFNYDADVGEHVPFTPYFNANDPLHVSRNNGNGNASAYAAMPESMGFQGGVPGVYPMSTPMQMQGNVQTPPPMMGMSTLGPWGNAVPAPAPAPFPQTCLPSPALFRPTFPPTPPPAYSAFGYQYGKRNVREEVIDLTRSDIDGGKDKMGATKPRTGRVQDENAKLRAQRDAIRMRDEVRREAERVRCENEWRGQEAERVKRNKEAEEKVKEKVKSERERERKNEDAEAHKSRQTRMDADVKLVKKRVAANVRLGLQWTEEEAGPAREKDIQERAKSLGIDLNAYTGRMVELEKHLERAVERMREMARLKKEKQEKEWENSMSAKEIMNLSGTNMFAVMEGRKVNRALKDLREEDVEGVRGALERLSVGGKDVDVDMVEDSHQQEEDWEVLHGPDVGCIMVDECVDSDDSDTWC